MVNAEKKKVTLTGGAPWGFRLTGGGALPLTVNKIRKKSQAAMQGLREGDAVLSINGEHVYDKTQDEALELVDKSGKFLTLEIFRGDISELGQDKPKKTIQVPSSGNEGAITISATVDSASSGSRTQVNTSSELVMTASVDNVTSDSFDTADSELSLSGFKLTATVDDVSGTTFDPVVSSDTTSGFTMTASVDDITSSSNAVVLESSPMISAEVGDISSSYVEDVQASTTLPTVMAEPFVDSQTKSPSPVITANTNNNIRYSPRGPSTSPKPPKSSVSPKPQQAYSPQPQPTLSPQPQATLSPQPQQNRSPQPPATFSPQPQQNLSPQPPASFSPQPPQTRSPQPPPSFSPQFQQNRSPQPPPSFSPQPVQTYSPQPPAVSPKPQRIVSPQAPPVSPKPPGVTSSVTSATFDDGQTRREVTREQHFQRSDDGNSSTVVEQETTTSFARPNFVKNQASAFNAVQPSSVQQQKRSTTTTTTTLQSTSNITNQKGPAPFVGSAPTSWQPSEFQTSNVSSSRSTGNLAGTGPVFKPTRFVPGSSKKEIPGLYTPTSPMVDGSVNAMYKQGKENVAPQPMFQVKNIVSDKAKTQGRETWRPNMWLPGQQPSRTYEEPSVVTTPKDDFSPYSSFPVPKIRPGYSLVEEQKRKLLESQTSRMTDYSDYYDTQDYADGQHHHKHGRLHVFAPPVEIHADSGYPESPYSPYEDHYNMEEYEDALSSPGSSVIRRKRNIYSDSAFYDTPGKSYPTINEQMKLCKKIAQSLTSAANKRARGAKMFMKRKRKSSKWVHEGHSEWSSSAGDVANLHDLDSELSPDEGGNKPLLYFKIPNLKNRVGNDAKQTKMALTQEQFEKLRLHSKKCEHKAVAPDTCFDIVADLKAHKGRGGRMFERRKQRSDKFVVEENRYAPPQAKLEAVLSQPVRQEKTPWEAAMEHGGNVDAAFSHLSEWERNQKLNQILKFSPPRKLQTTPMAPVVQQAPLPTVRSSLKSSDSPHMLKGKNFNRTARGWAGGGEYPVADHTHHVSPTRQLGPSQSAQSISQQQNYNNKIKAWQSPGESPYVQIPGQERQQDQWEARRHDNWQAKRQDDWRSQEWADPRQDMHNGHFEYQAPRPKSWQPDSYDGHSYREEIDYTYAPVDYRFMPSSSDYPKAYQQPIVPGTDL